MTRSCQILVCLFAFAGSASAAKITPVQKVLEMMNEMKVKGEKMLASEANTYATYKEWVSDRTTELGFEIKTGDTNIEQSIAFIEKANEDISNLREEIQELDDDIATLEGELHEATTVRAAENKEFKALQLDYSESVDALGRAIQTLTAQSFDRAQAESLLQQMAKTTPGMTRVLSAFLQETSKATQDGAPAVAAYETQSGGIVQVLEGLENKFKGELSDVEEAESNQAHNFNLAKIHLTDTITKSKSDRAEKAENKAQIAAQAAKENGELEKTREMKAEDTKMLNDMTMLFESKTSTYQENQKVRNDELEALAKAIEIISSPAVSDSYATHVNLVQVPKATMLLQTASSKRRAVAQQRAVTLLQDRAKALGSKTLAAFAAQAAANPFGKVINMIEELLAKLKEEAAAEADHKSWCDEQLKANKLKRDKKTAKADELNAQIESLAAQIDTLAEEIATLLQEQSDLAKAMNEATVQRSAEKAENTATIADAQAGSKAVKAALVVLREFYAKQAALLQVRQAPEMAEYKGMSGNKGGVVGMLEVIETDFLRLEGATKSAESQAAGAHDSFMSDAKADKQAKHESEVQKKLDKDQAQFDSSQVKKDLASTEAELAKANEYYEYLKPSCLEIHVSYEERVAGRKAEIAALKEAYGILDQK